MPAKRMKGRAWLGRILVVEDDPRAAEWWSMWIRDSGWDVVVAPTVASGLAALHQRVDGILLDLGLPDGSGFDVAVAARQRDPDVPVLVLTESLYTGNINRAHDLRAEYRCKPVSPEAVEQFLSRCRAANRWDLAALVDDVVFRYGLTATHGRIIHSGAARSTRREALAEELGVSLNTIKSEVSEILEGSGSMATAA